MSDTSRFQQKLVRIASSGTNRTGWRKLGPTRDGGLLAATLLEIDNTFLPRRLSFRAPQGEILTCTGANRRLVSVETDNGSAISPSVDDDDAVAALHTRLSQFLAGLDCIEVRAEPVPRDSLSGAVGISVESLAAAWQVPLHSDGSEDPATFVSTFLDRHRSCISAWCKMEDGRVETGGNPDEFGAVQALLTEMENALIEADGPALTLAPGGFFLILDDHGLTGSAKAFATLGSLSVALLAPEPGMENLSEDWQDAISATA